MEFNEKLQSLRKQKGITQEELADTLFVSRTAVSKWESGRGYPNIESLKAIAKLFSVTIDELLSSDELLNIAEADTKQKEKHIRDLVFGLLDVSVLMLLFLPFFAQKTAGIIQEVSLLHLTEISLYLKSAYIVFVVLTAVLGVLTLAFQNLNKTFCVVNKSNISLILNLLGVLLFIISLQPYAATILLIFLIIKALLLIKR